MLGDAMARAAGWSETMGWRDQDRPRPNTVEPIRAQRQRAVTERNRDNCWSVGVMNMTEREANAVMDYAAVLQRERAVTVGTTPPRASTTLDEAQRARDAATRWDEANLNKPKEQALDDEKSLRALQLAGLRAIDPNGELPRGTYIEFNQAANAYFMVDSLGFSSRLERNANGRLYHAPDKDAGPVPDEIEEQRNRFSGLDLG